MKHLILHRPYATSVVLALGILTTLVYDLSGSLGANSGGVSEWIVFALALVFRVFTYAAIFWSCGQLAIELRVARRRAVILAIVWSCIATTLAAFMWLWLSMDAELGQGLAVKRFTPDTLASFAPGWTMAEVAIGKEAAARYTWASAIGFEMLGLVAISAITAGFLDYVGRPDRLGWAYTAPILSFGGMLAYAWLLAPWSVVNSFDVFLGDALIGTMLQNAFGFPLTLIFGGYTAPAIWVGLIAISNVAVIRIWDQADGLKT